MSGLESFRPEQFFQGENKESREKKKVSNIDFTTRDGFVVYREKFEDGTVGDWQSTTVDGNSPGEFERLKQTLFSRYDLSGD